MEGFGLFRVAFFLKIIKGTSSPEAEPLERLLRMSLCSHNVLRLFSTNPASLSLPSSLVLCYTARDPSGRSGTLREPLETDSYLRFLLKARPRSIPVVLARSPRRNIHG